MINEPTNEDKKKTINFSQEPLIHVRYELINDLNTLCDEPLARPSSTHWSTTKKQ